ncbi:hypothetical protein [Lewinella sp. IMCC34191]|uniref:hypothetical protein n=1 Tax=Lewinella sp. IMCC34191 TaxID=2259172 RepID=UPI000E22AE7C|nr:hypothetical protein [Lewinella sp. IMCC34191]
MYKLCVLIVVLITLLACENPSGENNQPDTIPTTDETAIDTVENETLSGTTGDLQGKWRSADDSLHTLVFEGNLMTMNYAGEAAGEAENFVIGSTCPEAPATASTNDERRYLSVPDDNRCYYIIELNDSSLQMSYLGRGNTLRYTR